VPQIPKQKIEYKTCIISIIWGGTGIKSLLYVPKGMKYNITFFIESVVPNLVEHSCQESRRKTLQDMMVHLDSARPHNSRKGEAALTATKSRQIPAPAYSRHPSLSGFLVFGMSRNKCREHHAARQMN
jgi:hypothetical protein